MTSKLKCQWCGGDMMYSVLGQNLTSSHFCDNKDCKAFQMVLPDNLWKDIFAWKQSQKDLEKAIGAFEYILEKIKISKIVDPNDITITMIEGMCEMTLEQIEHKE